MSDTGHETYHGRTANGNSCIGVLFKNFYFGLITWLAGPLVISNPWMVLVSGIMVMLYYTAAKHEENQFLSSPNTSSAYEVYRQHAGMFLPKLHGKLKP